MSEMKGGADQLATSSLVNYTVLEIVHHEMGNGLAVIAGYTKLLLRSMVSLEEEISAHNWERALQCNEKRLAYLRIMQDREEYLNNFLAQLRNCSLDTVKKSFSQYQIKTNIVSLVRGIIEKLTPLYREHTLQTHFPTHPLYVLSNPLWIEFALEHILNHNIARHKASTPVVIEVKQYHDRSNDVHEIRIIIRAHIDQAEQKAKAEEMFNMWSRTLDERDQDLCIALCTGIFREHGGRIWMESDQEQRAVLYAALPLVK